jgi:hypothetical protein
MSASGKKIAIGVFCADWRLHQPHVQIVTQLRDHLGVDVVDMLVTAGPEGVVKNSARAGEKEALKNNLTLLIGAHAPVAVAFIGHQKCAGHPVSDEAHEADVAEMMREYKELTGFLGEMAALVATYTTDDEWNLKEVARISA